MACGARRIETVTTSMRRLTVATRGSALALQQTRLIIELLHRRFPDLECVIETVHTEGDRIQDVPISALGDKGIFVRPIERRLLAGDIDFAVHSLKDLPSDVETPGLELAAFSPRADPRDVLVSRHGHALRDLPPQARVGTGSLRRRAQLRAVRSDLVADDIRGNVDTRLRKLDGGQYDAIILAAAGLVRVGFGHRITEFLPLDTFVPDAGQGIMAVQVRSGDPSAEFVRAIDDPAARTAAIAERAVLRTLGADCNSPVGAYASLNGERIFVRGMAATRDGQRLYRDEESGPIQQSEMIGTALGERLLSLLNQ